MTQTFRIPGLPALTGTGFAFASVVLGGASQFNALFQSVVIAAGCAVLGVGIVRLPRWNQLEFSRRISLALVLSVLALPLLHLIPLPTGLWLALPGRESLSDIIAIQSPRPGWLPFSLTPDASFRCFLFLLPPAGLFILTLGLSQKNRMTIFTGYAVTAVLCAIWAGLQVASGGNEALYLYDYTDFGLGVGPFANRNHAAAFVVTMAVASTGYLLDRADRLTTATRLFLASVVMGLAVVMIAVIRSRAGVVMLGIGLLAIAVIVLARPDFRKRLGKTALLAFPVIAALVAVGLFAITPLLERFTGKETRLDFWPKVIEQGNLALPLGHGLGSFVPVFTAGEQLADVSDRYINQAHNEYLQIWLEAGLPGALLTGLAVVWLALNARRAWPVGQTGNPQARPESFNQAISVCLLLLALHSAVDYPLRTQAIACLFAFFAACILAPPAAAKGEAQR